MVPVSYRLIIVWVAMWRIMTSAAGEVLYSLSRLLFNMLFCNTKTTVAINLPGMSILVSRSTFTSLDPFTHPIMNWQALSSSDPRWILWLRSFGRKPWHRSAFTTYRGIRWPAHLVPQPISQIRKYAMSFLNRCRQVLFAPAIAGM